MLKGAERDRHVSITHLDDEADVGVVHATGGDVAGEHDALQGRNAGIDAIYSFEQQPFCL
jgi:hypothetical protein